MERKEGYYWVKYNGQWEIAFYNVDESAFERHLDDAYSYDEELEEIDEKMILRNK
jgi:hypothetical protein